MKKPQKTIICISILLTVLGSMTLAYANSAEPPGLTVIVSFPPSDLAVSIRFSDGSIAEAIPLQKDQKAWEAYYRFFYHTVASARPSFEGAVLIAQSGEGHMEWPIPETAYSQYNNLITLDLKNQRIMDGQSPVRFFLLVTMRVALTLLIEGLIFLAFGYRKKASWIAFLVINLVTQGALNIALSGPNLGSYWMFGLVFYEIIIFIVEGTAFALALKDHKKAKAVVYALAANAASLVLGGVLIAYLPV